MFYTAILILVIYIVYIFIRYKQIPKSLSETYYLGSKYWFTIVMIIIGQLLMMALINVTPLTYQFLSFFTGVGLMFVGAAPCFKEDLQNEVHSGGAVISALCSQAWVCLYGTPWILLTWLSTLLWFNTKQRTFWAEIICIINVIIAYLLG